MQVKEFTTHGLLLREIRLASELVNPHHTIMLTNGQLLICHGFESDPTNRLCIVDATTGTILKYLDCVSSSDKLLQPTRIAVAETLAAAFIADFKNDRIVVVDLYAFKCVSVIKGVGRRPCGMFIDSVSGTLYVGSWETGQINVFNIRPA